jgi:hypothetical protein
MKKKEYPDKKCIVCGKVIVHKNQSLNQWQVVKFCSKACWGKRGKRVTKKCLQCGTEFSRPYHEMHIGKKREVKCCSRKCSFLYMTGERSPHWKGRKAFYGMRFRDALSNTSLYRHWRNDVKKRDNYKCVNCGEKKENLHVHHIYPLAQIIKDEEWTYDDWTKLHHSPDSRLWDIANGATLCPECHFSLISFALQSKGYGKR